ncbi:N-acetylglucosamine-6-phosphate deacetylase [Candidatus Avelusimicrobium stercoris]|uniref:N-acetylglucosamine-6-phosphate deacetylase n=1 Tax=Candidatus Avelusimicrobium stercoris TaxID=1947924 RepID=UPI003D116ACF
MQDLLITDTRAVLAGEIRPATLWLSGGKIKQIITDETPLPNVPVFNAQGALAVPGFIDPHIHGFAGHGPENAAPEDLLEMSKQLAQYGVSAFCPTLYCARPHEMESLLKTLLPALGKETGAQIIGFHLEGPFISPKKPGVMKPQDIVPPQLADMERLYEAAQGHITNITLAPELPGISPIIDFCLAHGILVQGGHTNATYDEFLRGAQQGVKHATHLFNAMSGFNHRAPGAAGAVLMHPEISCEIIADGVHVHPDVVGFLRQVKPLENIVAITDALKPTGLTDGPFIANGEEVILDGGVWKRKTDKVIAGSALTMAQAFKNLVAFGYTPAEAVQLTSTNAARLLDVSNKGRLEEGFAADIVLLDPQLNLQAVFLGGKKQ